ncbi:protein-tyrosine phosphatase family protein [Puerhibacterium sp. TATVAM-FAB25]|uniref:protein-tyrosine phosphatase family protein n=1 Tax=Puerhibacterium sp. TATVAM-FAB25 TaxID=3093699 RepID=UPI00397CF00D
MSTWDTAVPGVVELPDGRRVRGTGVRLPRGDVPAPDLAVYLLAADPGPAGWPYRWVRWRDFGLPAAADAAVAALRDAHDRAADERVEIACGAGRGRTGSALALLAVMSGVEPRDAVAWVRAHYHPRAAETPWQRAWVRRAGARLRG